MKTKKLVSWQKVKNEVFSREEQARIDNRARLKIALRRLRERRERLGMTQETLAKKADVPRTTVSKIESGYQNASIGKLMQLADAMGMRVEVELVGSEA